MPNAVFRQIFTRVLPSKRIKGRLWKHWYRYFDRRIASEPLRFMNYGLALREGESLELDADDEPDRTCIQLYDRVASPVNLEGKTVLEVSAGRGGGADFLARYRKPKLVTGLDRTEGAIAFAQKRYNQENLRFVLGDAMQLPFEAESFDIVLNVEASHCYPDVPQFLSEVRRVLVPGGYFLYADFRREARLDGWRRELEASGLTIQEEEDITERVVEALAITHDRKVSLVRSAAPRLLRRVFSQFAGTKGSVMYRAFETGRARYVRFALRK